MAKQIMDKIYIVGPRPDEAPQGWTVWNAPRPLYGARTWAGEFITGRLYAAQNPDDPDPNLPYETVVEENRRLHACELVYISAEEFRRRVDEWSGPYAEKLGIDLTEFDFLMIAQSFTNQSKERYIAREGIK